MKQTDVGSPKPCPDVIAQDDGFKVTISTTFLGCGRAGVACVDKFQSHPGNLAFDIVHPFDILDPSEAGRIIVHRYTIDSTMHLTVIDEDPNDGVIVKFLHLPSIVMHEFGHTAGMDDLYNYPEDLHRYAGSIMLEALVAHTSIPDFDKDYMKQIYRNEHGAKAHE